MSTCTETISNKLNGLLEKTYDAEKGFKKAAENTEHPYLKKYFERKAAERYNFGHELKTEIRSFGEQPDKSGSITGTAHRAWMDIKTLFSSDNDESMLEEAIRGEKAALEEYNDVLNETSLTHSTHTILLKQRGAIDSDLRTIKRLEDLG
ncbi:ferritin-like domain-containing protein [Mariniflexile sp.]|uniref:ferritin-like domain-containing protein n=1 Tax=Mariniflexile sp. TaxID=1979402 RepID=UPI00404727EC